MVLCGLLVPVRAYACLTTKKWLKVTVDKNCQWRSTAVPLVWYCTPLPAHFNSMHTSAHLNSMRTLAHLNSVHTLLAHLEQHAHLTSPS